MGRLGDLLAPSDVAYPGTSSGSAGCGDAPYQPPERAGFINRLFSPTDLPYPLPSCGVGYIGPKAGPASPTPATSGTASTTATPSAPPASTDAPGAPVTVVVNVPGRDATQTSTLSSAPTAKLPVGDCPVLPVQKIVTAYSTNPRLRARHPRAQEILVEEMIDEKLTLRMLTKDSAPVAFVVPDGCTAVDFTIGAIEPNPGVGLKSDLDDVVTVGDLIVDGVTAGTPLKAGDQISVVVPWRYGSWVEMAADHLRLPIFARFFQIQNA